MEVPSRPVHGPRPARRARHRAAFLVLVGLAIALGVAGSAGGCARGKDSDDDHDEGKAAVRFAYDDGPADPAAAAKGKALFMTRGCSACHAFGRRVTGPDLAGVTKRRSAQWISTMIQHPDEMTKSDPIAHELLGTYAVQMPVLKVTEDEAETVIEFFKTQEAPAGAK